MVRKTMLAVAGAISSVSAAPTCDVHPAYGTHIKEGPAAEWMSVWMWSDPYQVPGEAAVTPNTCYGRTSSDALTYDDCASKCSAMNNPNAGINNAKVACLDTPTKYMTFNAVFVGGQQNMLFGPANADGSTYAFMWSSLKKSGGTWSDSMCGTPEVWGNGVDDTQELWSSSPGETATDTAVWVFGQDAGEQPDGADYGATPFQIGVTGSAPNPDDIFCWCQWDAFDPEACETSTYGCCDGDDTTVFKDDVLGTNCVGGAGYVNAKEVTKAWNDTVNAVVGLGTGILVAVIVGPIVGLILLCICIFCIVKNCCNSNKPSA